MARTMPDFTALDFPQNDNNLSKMDMTGLTQNTRKIGILPIGGFGLMSYAATVEPLRAANLLANLPLYEIINITCDPPQVQSSGAAVVVGDALVGDALKLDFLFVIAGGNPASFTDRRVLNWIARVARSGTTLGGVSGGPVILARAGLMKDRRMTVHWEHASALAEMSPDLLLERTLYVIDRDRLTCAGGAAPMDLMHALIAEHHGAPFARLVSDWFLHTEIRSPGGPQRGGLAARLGTTNAAVLDAVNAMENHVADPMTLNQLATVAQVSPRQLNRLFSTKLHQPVMRYYRGLRLDKAQNLLRNSPLAITDIALASGFANSSHFSRAYSARFHRPPSNARP